MISGRYSSGLLQALLGRALGQVEAVSRVAVPLLLVRGTLPQSVVDDEDEAELLRRCPTAHVERIADAGHSVQGDSPVEHTRLIDDFAPGRSGSPGATGIAPTYQLTYLTEMNVGVYFDLRNPPGWATDFGRLYAFTLEMCEEAEHLGCHSIWLSEHHRFDDGYLPQPLTLAAAVAARTRAVRIGTAIVIAPLHHPAELAEQSAIVDVISGGRLELGLGAGYRVPEFELYGADLAIRYTETDGRAREVRRLWDEGIVTPGPLQERLPIWMGYQGPKGARRAGQLGEGLLSVNPMLVEPYRAGLADGGHDPGRARMAGGIQGWATEDPEADWPVVARHLAHQVDSYRRHMVEGTDQPTPRPIDPERLRQRDFGGPLSYFLYGTPEEVAARLQAHIGDAPVETVFFWASVSGMAEEMVAHHVQTICTRVAPLLAPESDRGPAVP